jgi:hypothetical protein
MRSTTAQEVHAVMAITSRKVVLAIKSCAFLASRATCLRVPGLLARQWQDEPEGGPFSWRVLDPNLPLMLLDNGLADV